MPGRKKQLTQLQQAFASRGQVLQFLPLQQQNADYTAVFSTDQQQPILVLSIAPWIGRQK